MFDFNKTKKIGEDAIDTLMVKVSKAYRSKACREELHVLLVACAEHMVKHNGADKFTNLFTALPENANKRGIGIWITRYCPGLEYRKDAAKKMKWLASEGYKFIPAGETDPFYDMAKVKKDNETIPSFAASILKLVSVHTDPKKLAKETDYDKAMLAQVSRTVDLYIQKHGNPTAKAA